MKTLLYLILSICLMPAYAQTIISGSVVDSNGETVPGANIFIENTYDGSSSGDDGKFTFESTENGAVVLVVKFLGYKEYRKDLLLDGKVIILDVVLVEEVNQLNAITITAGAFTASDESRRTIFKAVDIASTAGATADIAGALNTLPGTQKVGESGRLFVRGGDGSEARTFIDGMVVLDAYGPAAPNTPSRGRFLPFMFKGTSFSTGGYSAEYGQALSSALVLDSRDQAEATRTDFGILSVGGDVAHTQRWERGSIAGKIQYTNLRPYMGLINQEIDWDTPPASVEGVAAFRQQVGKQGMVKVYGNFNRSDYSLYNHDIDDYTIKTPLNLTNNYRYLNGFYKDFINDKWTVRGGVSYNFQQNEIGLPDRSINEVEKGIHAKTVFEGTVSDRIELKTGVEVINRDYSQVYDIINATNFDLSFNEVITAGFAEADLIVSNKFVTRAGGRVEYNSLIGDYSIDPRVSLGYKVADNGQVSFAYGTFRQTARNEYMRINHDLDAEKAEHFIMNYQIINNDRTFRIETYYKRYDNLVKFMDTNPNNVNNDGTGYAKGVELFWRDNKSIRNADYWVSYSYLDTERDYLNFPSASTPAFASAHNFSFVYKHFVQSIKSQLGFTYSYTSGRPYNNPNEEKFNTSKTPYYSDLSFNMAYLPKPNLIVYFSCTNLLGRDNIFGYEYSSQQNDEGMYNSRAIRQAAPRFLFLGIFITLSKDKSVNQLPTL